MAKSEIRKVLANWIDQASSPIGRLPESVSPADWVAKQFISWWQSQVEDSIGDAEVAAHRLREELVRLEDSKVLGEAFHELTHIEDALGDLRVALGLTE